MELIDASIVIVDLPSSWYRISEPVRAYVIDNYPSISEDDYATLANHLQKFLEESDSDDGYLELSRVLFRAYGQAGLESGDLAYSLVSDWIRLAEDNYHSRRYEHALGFAMEAYERRPSVPALEWKIRAEVKLDKYVLAEESLGLLRKLGDTREADFLTGFMQRHRGNYSEAINYYGRAFRAGRGGMAIQRDMADCYYHLGDYPTALRLIHQALERDPKNRFLLSLRLRISTKLGDEDGARKDLAQLQDIDSPAYYSYQKARFELRFGRPGGAYPYAVSAVRAMHSKVPVDFLVTQALAEILTDRFDDAESTVARIDGIGRSSMHDTSMGLQIRIKIGRQEFEDALALARTIVKNDTPVHLRLLRDSIDGLLNARLLPADERDALDVELSDITTRLSAISDTNWDLTPE